MGLSTDLISQFAKITNDNKRVHTGASVYGTAKEYDGEMYVQFDGSELLTPIETTTNLKSGERVTVTVYNHTATVAGNLSSPSARDEEVRDVDSKVNNVSDNLELNYLKAKEIEAEYATFEHLTANYAEIGHLHAEYAVIEDLKAEFADIDHLHAQYATFDELEAKYATIESLDAKYANIDFANITDLAVENFLAKSGMVEDLIVSDGHVTGKLVGVEIHGDLITGGTIKADRLIVKGQDGIYYQMNVEGGTFTGGEAVPDDSLHGSILTAHSVTANEIYVDDLYAFDATIGGFIITDHSIYSGVKESVENTTRGVYLDKEGQIAFGDARNYIKYYLDETDNKYKLDISAAEIRMGVSNKTVEEEIAGKVDDLEIGGRNLIQKSQLDSVSCNLTVTSTNHVEVAGVIDGNVSIVTLSGEYEAGEYVFNATGSVSGKNFRLLLNKSISDSCVYNEYYESNGYPYYIDVVTPINLTFTETTKIGLGMLSENGDQVISELKLEKGDKATDWTPAPEDVDEKIDDNVADIHKNMDELNASIATTCEGVVIEATKNHVELDEYNTLREQVETALSVMPGEIRAEFTTTVSELEDETSSNFNKIYKYISFTENGIAIGDNETGIVLEIDNDMIVFKKKDAVFGYWDGNDFFTGNVVVRTYERAQFGNFAFIPRKDGSLSLLKVGDTEFLQIITHPRDIEAIVGDEVVLKVYVLGYNVSYQWQSKSSENASWINVPAPIGTSSSITLSSVSMSSNGYYYRCIVSDDQGRTVTSEAAKITVRESPDDGDTGGSGSGSGGDSGGGSEGGGSDTGGENVNPITIVNHPNSIAVTSGQTAAFNVAATGDDLTYKWQYSDSQNGPWTDISAEYGSSSTYTINSVTADMNGRWYRCVISDSNGQSMPTDAAQLTVNRIAVQITSHPTSRTVDVGASTTFYVSATGTDLTYKWYYKRVGDDVYTATAESATATSWTYTPTDADLDNGMEVYCVVRDAADSSNYDVSNSAYLYISGYLKITKQPESVEIDANQTATFTVEAVGNDLSFKWYYIDEDGSSLKEVTTDTYTTIVTDSTSSTLVTNYTPVHVNGRKYCCRVVSGSNVKTEWSDYATLTINGKPEDYINITKQPSDIHIEWDTYFSNTITAESTVGATLSYQWEYKNDGDVWCAATAASAKTEVWGREYSKESWQIFPQKVRCKITDSLGNELYSEEATVTAPEVVMHQVTLDLTNCTASNNPLWIEDGETFRTTIIFGSGYDILDLDFHMVSMGGVEMLPYNDCYDYDTNEIVIPNVTGDLYIKLSMS